MARAYVSIGSNINREHNIRSAIAMLRARFGAVTVSRVYETEAVGFDGEPFFNLAAGFETDMPVDQLLEWLDDIENQHGRDRSEPRFGPRTLDMDLLLYDALVDTERHLPREEITRYAFVLGPLAEIAAEVRHPPGGRTYAELWADFPGKDSQLRSVELALDPPGGGQ